ncbi:MAG: LPS assembly protein LptD [Oligoflexia bacterium]|nr:LPS assembly protein LptD [Oligoflexia bacterium]
MKSFGVLIQVVMLGAVALAPVARAVPPIDAQSPIHASGDREIWDRKTNRIELFGHAMIRQPGETLSADHVVLDRNSRTIDAYGNCVYIASDSVIYGEEMHFNLETRTGTIVGGRVSSENFTLGGERINKLGQGRFQTHWGEYSTCRDCAQSWSLQAQDVDMEVEGYAYLRNVAVKIKDTPAMWFPYLVVPLKTRRQTGFLLPSVSLSSNSGVGLLQPFFWATSRSTDMTFSAGQYTGRGARFQWEGRYALSPRSTGQLNYYFLRDSEFLDPGINPSMNRTRWALRSKQVQELPWGIEAKLDLSEVSDNFYLTQVAAGDPTQRDLRQHEMVMGSSLSLDYSTPDLSAYVAARRYRNLVDLDGLADPIEGVRRFDPYTVQPLPIVAITTNDRLFFGSSLAGGLTLGLANFTRRAGPFDLDPENTTGVPVPGVDPIREATRFSVVPSVYTTYRPWDAFSVSPSVRYFGYYYDFRGKMDNLFRGYLLFQTDLSAQLEKVFDTQNPDRPRVKHLIRPLLTYSYIPRSLLHPLSTGLGTAHPFVGQTQRMGYYFDNQDLVPLDASPSENSGDPSSVYFVPLGNSLTIGLRTQVIQRRGKLSDSGASYSIPLDFSAGQALNFREYQLHPDRPKPLSRFVANLRLNYPDPFYWDTYYEYYPYVLSTPELASSGIVTRHKLDTSASYVFERSLHQRILRFDRSMSVGFNRDLKGNSTLSTTINFSLSDYVMPTASAAYSLKSQSLTGGALGLVFQSPSQCWRLSFSIPFTLDPVNGLQRRFEPLLQLNLTGSGFDNPTEIWNPT